MMNPEVTHFIEKSPEQHRIILTKLRNLIFTMVPEAKEQFKWSRPVYGLEKDFCYLQATKKHVVLGFFEFDKITTNSHLIEGSGKSMRHLKITNLSEIADHQLGKMIQEALE